jgi:hypothetical protein
MRWLIAAIAAIVVSVALFWKTYSEDALGKQQQKENVFKKSSAHLVNNSISKSPSAELRRKLIEKEASAKLASEKLLDGQTRLARKRKEIYKENPALGQAYVTMEFFSRWESHMGNELADVRGWWPNDPRNYPERRKAIRAVTRELLLQEIILTLNDPASTSWIMGLTVDPSLNSPGRLGQRDEWWYQDLPAPSFGSLPPPDTLRRLLDPSTRQSVLDQFTCGEEGRNLIDPKVMIYLKEAARAGVLATSAGSFYDSNDHPEIKALKAEVDELSRKSNNEYEEFESLKK